MFVADKLSHKYQLHSTDITPRCGIAAVGIEKQSAMLLLTKGNCKAVGIHKGWWPNDLDPVEACFTEYTKQPTRANTPVPDGGILLLFL